MGTVDLLIKNAKVYYGGHFIEGGVAVDGGVVVCVGKDPCLPEADRVIDAGGKLLIPGAIDGHVHVREPWERSDRKLVLSASDVSTDTQAAAVGGVTTVINQPNVHPAVVDSKSLKRAVKVWEGRSYVDYGFHGGIKPKTDLESVERLWSEGVMGLKIFLASSDPLWPPLDDGDLLYTLQKTGELDALPIIHAENDSIIARTVERLKALSRRDYASHLEGRPPVAEVEAVRRAAFLLSKTGSKGLIAHVSVAESVFEVLKVREGGGKVYLETCPQYLFLSNEDLKVRGPWLKCAPPLRERGENAKLWNLLNRGFIDVLGSDHAPHPRELKERGFENFWEAPNGFPGVETTLPLMLTAVNEGRLSLKRLVEVFCENPAKLYGLYPKKGVISVGSDGDLVLIDLKQEEVVSSDRLKMKCGWSPYEGFRLKGVPTLTVVRGEVVMEDREIVGTEGHGRHVRRLSETCVSSREV